MSLAYMKEEDAINFKFDKKSFLTQVQSSLGNAFVGFSANKMV